MTRLDSPTSPGHLFYGETPLDELRQTIAFAIWHAVDRETGAEQYLPCTHDSCTTQPPFDAAKATAQRHDAEFVKRKHLVALRLAVEVGQDPQPWVTNARETGMVTWAEIADVLGVSRQAAQQRFSVPGVEDGVCPECGGSFAGLVVRGKIGYHSSSPGQRCSGVGKAAPKGAVR